MQPDLLQQLRDIHLPPEPGWWPPAPGWWALALLAAAALIWLVYLALAAWRRQRPIRYARQVYATLFERYRNGELTDAEYLHEANELLKRLYVHGLKDDAARPAQGCGWLAYLDARSGTRAFSDGPGRQLGNQRFAEDPDASPETLHPLILELLREAKA